MKARVLFEIMELDDEKVAVPVGENAEKFNGVLKVNDTAVSILKLIERDISENEIVDELLKEYTGDKVQISKYVHEFIDKLTNEGLIEHE